MKNIKTIFFLVLLSITLGCDKFVEVDLPNSLLTSQQVFDNPQTVRAALANVYTKLRTEGVLSGSLSGGGSSLGLYADELINYSLAGTPSDGIYNNVLIASNPTVLNFWNSAYNHIYCANSVLEGINSSNNLTESEKNMFKGEALFVRGLVHFYLLNIFGDVPYVSTTDFEVNKRISRSSVSNLYQLIIADLVTAERLLMPTYLSSERTIPNKAVATALLARVYLYDQKWSEAAASATAIINNPNFTFNQDLNLTFLKESATTIWQFKPQLANSNALEGTYIFTSAPPPSVSLRNELFNAFEPGDKRRDQWVKAVQGSSAVYYHAYKYKQNVSTTPSKEYSVVFRLAEQYLIRAEARAKLGDLTGALQDINKIRGLAGLNNSQASTISAVLDAILQERRVEFFTEFGHRFFDLKRTGKISSLSTVKPGWDINDVLWPIPETELLTNPLLKPQNPGY